MKITIRLTSCLIVAATLLALQPVLAQERTPGSEWLSYNNRLDGQRYSPLKEITPANAAQLGEVCRIQIDGPTSYHAGLIVVDGVIYTGTGRETFALDASNCAVRWKLTYQGDEERCGGSNRGVAVLDGRVFRGTCDGRLIALDAATGKLLWKSVIAAPRLGEGTSAAPIAAGGVVYMGISGSELGVRGRILAFDAATGKELWRFNTIPMGKEQGAETWKRPLTAKTGGGGVWGAMTLDVTTGELFVPVGNPWPDIDKAYRPGANLFTDSIVVLDARTGALKWWHQVSPEDWMDLDLVAPPVLYRGANVRDIVAFGGKDGYVTGIDRDTRKVIFRTPVTTVQHIPKMPSPEGMRVCPGYAGGVEWNGPALDPVNKQLVTGAVDACFKVTLGKTEYTAGAASFGGTVEPVGETSGWVTAIDNETGAVRWQYHAEKPVVAGVTPTAGGVTITGDLAGNLLVFNSKTGELAHKAKAGGAMAGGVVTYEVGGRQYLAFAAGNISRNAFGDLGLPSVVIMMLNPQRAATVAAPVAAAVAGRAGVPNLAAGNRLYSQVCVSCHGPDGNMLADHKLGNLKSRLDLAATIAYIKSPKAPMPKLFPDLINEQSVLDVAAYLHSELGR
ncbi:MAG TPA: PQQ-binding-like beta-propeller repeat protein [Steroidobacteraceae bacterium]|jgi:alcohol dehydrogenase (cytochrome c)|nr:PQQ-binding-like beta-propeller repeat protein [Steroidobacteraceae bacterium]